MNNPYNAGKELLCGDYTAYTPSGASLFSKEKRYDKTPKTGAIVYFYSSSLKRISHVGLVTMVTDKGDSWYIKTIEGNTAAGKQFERDGGEVARKSYTFLKTAVGGTNLINGFGMPRYGKDTCYVYDLVGVAEGWLDYVEKESNGTEAQLALKHWNPGDKNYTLFGYWYGLNPGAWCQMFISHIAYLACKKQYDARATEWREADGYWFYYKDGVILKDTWAEIGGRWYVFDNMGRAVTNSWFESNGVWYYLGADSAMLSNQWLKYKEKWYYLTSSGAMATNAYVVDKKVYCYVNEEGVWDEQYVKAENIQNGVDIID